MKRKQVIVLEVTFEDDEPPHEWDWADMANEYDDDENAPQVLIEVIAMGNPVEVQEELEGADLQSALAALAASGAKDPYASLGMPTFTRK